MIRLFFLRCHRICATKSEICQNPVGTIDQPPQIRQQQSLATTNFITNYDSTQPNLHLSSVQRTASKITELVRVCTAKVQTDLFGESVSCLAPCTVSGSRLGKPPVRSEIEAWLKYFCCWSRWVTSLVLLISGDSHTSDRILCAEMVNEKKNFPVSAFRLAKTRNFIDKSVKTSWDSFWHESASKNRLWRRSVWKLLILSQTSTWNCQLKTGRVFQFILSVLFHWHPFFGGKYWHLFDFRSASF